MQALAPSRLPIPFGLLALYGPTYWEMGHGLWQSDEQGHAPIIALICAWLFWRSRASLRAAGRPARFLGGLVLGGGLLAYAGGRALQIPVLEVGSQIPVFAGLLLLRGGTTRLREFRFPLGLLLFMLPLPGVLIDALTAPLKEWISTSAEALLYLAGYPVARNGVVLSLSQYRLLVADACSGLYSMIFLSALGLLFMHLVARKSRLHNALLLCSILPIALAANLARVLFILLITYHFGDYIGQGPLHDLSGMGVFMLALLLLFLLDAMLLRILPRPPQRPELRRSPTDCPVRPPSRRMPGAALLAIALLATAGLAVALQPSQRLQQQAPTIDLAALIPQRFADWRLERGRVPVPPSTVLNGDADALYSQILARSYVNDAGQRVMLSIAYGANQLHDRIQAHRPEYCYRAQGFALQTLGDSRLSVAFGSLPVRHLVASRPGRVEPITYWMVLGEEPVLPGVLRKLAQLRHGLAGEIPDGMLIRVSSIERDPAAAYVHHGRFIRDLLAALDETTRVRLAGHLEGQMRGGHDSPAASATRLHF